MKLRKEPPKTYADKLAWTEVFDEAAIDWPQWVDADERMLMCIVCDTWTKHVRLTDGWMCACGEYIPLSEWTESDLQ